MITTAQITYFLYAMIGGGLIMAYFAMVNLFRRDRNLNKFRSAIGQDIPLGEEPSMPPLAAFFKQMNALTGASAETEKAVALEALQAGVTSPNAVHYLLFFKRIVQPLLFLPGLYFAYKLLGTSGQPLSAKLVNLISAGILLLGAVRGSRIYLTNVKQKRQKRLLKSFPEALDLLLVCIESGLGLDAAIGRVGNELKNMHPDMAAELDRTRIELTVMNDRAQALINLAERTQIAPFKSLVSSLIQTEKFGTSLVDTLRIIAEDLRVSRLMSAENKAARIPVLITLPLIFFILPALFIVIIGPPMIKISQQGGLFGAGIQR